MKRWVCGVLVAVTLLLMASWTLDKPLSRDILGLVDVARATEVEPCDEGQVRNPVTGECECECTACQGF